MWRHVTTSSMDQKSYPRVVYERQKLEYLKLYKRTVVNGPLNAYAKANFFIISFHNMFSWRILLETLTRKPRNQGFGGKLKVFVR